MHLLDTRSKALADDARRAHLARLDAQSERADLWPLLGLIALLALAGIC